MRTQNTNAGGPAADPEDKRAAEAVRRGDPDAFRHFLDAYGGTVERLLAGHLPAESVPDVAQEVFVRAFGSLDGYDTKRPFGGWLKTIALRCCYERLRTIYADRETAAGSMDDDARNWAERAAAVEADREMTGQEQWESRQLLRYALDRIAPRDRMVLWLTVLEGYTAAEAAGLLEISEVNVRVRAFRAKRRLRAILIELMEETA